MGKGGCGVEEEKGENGSLLTSSEECRLGGGEEEKGMN